MTAGSLVDAIMPHGAGASRVLRGRAVLANRGSKTDKDTESQERVLLVYCISGWMLLPVCVRV
jgi:hypothetical protein